MPKAHHKMTFTDAKVASIKHPPLGKQVRYWDGGDKGTLGLSVLVSHEVKSWAATFYRDGKATTVRLGRVGEMSLDEARKRTREYRGKAADGFDPRPTRETPPALRTYEQVVDEFVTVHCKPSQRTWRQTEYVLKRHCPAFLNKPFASIAKQDARSALEGFNAEGKWAKAQVTYRWFKKLWAWATDRDYVPATIMTFALPTEKKTRDRFYSYDEVKAIWQAAGQCTPAQGAFYKLLLLLAPRKTALGQMKWSDIKDGTWTTPFEFTKSKKTSAKKRVYLTPLPPLALRIIKALPKNGERVLAGVPSSLDKRYVKATIGKHGAPKDFNYHAARHTIATFLKNAGHSEWERGLVLNHAESGVTAGYSHGYPIALKLELLTKWSDHVEALVTAAGTKLFA
jgi:integrase